MEVERPGGPHKVQTWGGFGQRSSTPLKVLETLHIIVSSIGLPNHLHYREDTRSVKSKDKNK